MIRADVVVDTSRLDDLANFARNHPRYIQRAATAAFALPEGKPSLIAKLSEAPGQHAAEPWGGWSTNAAKDARARRKWFQMIRDGEVKTDGRHYIRTGALAEGYDAALFFEGGEILMSITNKANRAHLYTKGRRQVPGHAATGWQKDAPVVTQWLAEWRQTLIGELRVVAHALG